MCAGDPIKPNYVASLFLPALGDLFIFNKKDEKIHQESTIETKKIIHEEPTVHRSLSSSLFKWPILNKNTSFDLHLESNSIDNLESNRVAQTKSNLNPHVNANTDLDENVNYDSKSTTLVKNCSRSEDSVIPDVETEITKQSETFHKVDDFPYSTSCHQRCHKKNQSFPLKVQLISLRVAKRYQSFPFKVQLTSLEVAKRNQSITAKPQVYSFFESIKILKSKPVIFKKASNLHRKNKFLLKSCDTILYTRKKYINSSSELKPRRKFYIIEPSITDFYRIGRRKKYHTRRRYKKKSLIFHRFKKSKIYYKSYQYKNYSIENSSKESGLMNSSTRFPRRKPSRRNSTSQLYPENSKEFFLGYKTSEKQGRDLNSSSSVDNNLSTKLKYKKCSEEEGSKERSQNTVKLIDKYLNMLSINEKTLLTNRNQRELTRSSYKLDFKTPINKFEGKNTYDMSVKSKNQVPILAKRKEIQKLLSSTQSLNDSGNVSGAESKQSKLSLPSKHNTLFNDDRRRMYSSLDGITYESDGFGEKLITAAFLARIDNVLSVLVDEEKRKIKKLHYPKSFHASYETINLPYQRIREYRLARSKRNEPQRVFIRYRPKMSSDLLDKHSRFFTSEKPFKPRILKTDVESKLEPNRLYRNPRRKRRRKKKKVEKESNYSDDFESPRSSQATSSDQESIEGKDTSSSLDLSNDEIDPAKPRVIAEDEDDTCYGSDQISSDMMNEQLDSFKEKPPQVAQKDYGDFSIDSAYIGSREATPDIKTIGSDFKIKNTGAITKITNTTCLPRENSIVQKMNDCRRFLLGKIKESGLYTDSHINALLEYYSNKWKHIPKREMNIIVSFIRRDLGVTAPPKTCIDFLLNKDTPSLEENGELSTEKCLTVLSSSLSQYIKGDRKAVSASCSPDHSIFAFNKVRYSSCSTESSVENQQSSIGKNLTSVSKNTKARFLKSVEDIENPKKRDELVSRHLYNFEESFNDDEEWIRETCGKDMLKIVKDSLNDTNSSAYDFFTSTDDIDKMASDLCEEFGLVL